AATPNHGRRWRGAGRGVALAATNLEQRARPYAPSRRPPGGRCQACAAAAGTAATQDLGARKPWWAISSSSRAISPTLLLLKLGPTHRTGKAPSTFHVRRRLPIVSTMLTAAVVRSNLLPAPAKPSPELFSSH